MQSDGSGGLGTLEPPGSSKDTGQPTSPAGLLISGLPCGESGAIGKQ